ncbi:hydroxymethylglutaryl-CoA lyase [Pedobacter sp. SD-b]|uniref:Hydroxymethylglutaryl-CoA lyase n=1 Tax=Pedobacter segetis TaxID=2793069 RepID=A0ABS1BKW3_9SPHI|nr:hydroxymethylglutaryl-CoA lyase [Pedobacter segetis]MBK0383491.1 hydroxymethylglutaryl-CoA lyase [Pedobacter segetis]
MPNKIKLIECPRDAMQGIIGFVPTNLKAKYINLLLKVGFDTIDFGSFVSAKAIPQMKDTAELVKKLDLSGTKTKLLAIVANQKGAMDACAFEEISYLGFPFSVSEIFQKRNTNATREEALIKVREIKNLCDQYHKKLMVYVSMGFGNPYGEAYDLSVLDYWSAKLVESGIKILALSDTIGVSNKENIAQIYPRLTQNHTQVEWGLHLHSTPAESEEKIIAAFESGCTRFDTAIKGYGGCPMAKDELTGNIATEKVLAYLNANHIDNGIDENLFSDAIEFSDQIFTS